MPVYLSFEIVFVPRTQTTGISAVSRLHSTGISAVSVRSSFETQWTGISAVSNCIMTELQIRVYLTGAGWVNNKFVSF